VSDFVTNHIRREFPKVADRCETFYNGIDPNEFVCERDYAATRERTEKQLLFVGAVSPHSGVHVLLEAFKAVVRKYPDVHLNIVGPDGNYPLGEVFDLSDRAELESVAGFDAGSIRERLRTILSLLPPDTGSYISYLKGQLSPHLAGKVTFWGWIGVRPQLVQHYYGADVFVFSPVCDHGFGLSPVEAMAAGVPCVVTKSGATVETVKNDETGFLVDKNDPKALAQAIVSLLENDQMREAMGRAARRRVLEHFTWDKAAQRTFDRYLRLCEMVFRAGDRCLVGTGSEITAAVELCDVVRNQERNSVAGLVSSEGDNV
jgi:glycosyltransferase involved in cell wall biosynthesis